MSDEVFGTTDGVETLPSFLQLFRHIPEPSPVEPRTPEPVTDKFISPFRIMEPDPLVTETSQRRAVGIPAHHHVTHQFWLIVIPEVAIGDLLHIRLQGLPNLKESGMASPFVPHFFVRNCGECEVVFPIFFTVCLLEIYVKHAVFNFGCKITIVFFDVIISYIVTPLKQF